MRKSMSTEIVIFLLVMFAGALLSRPSLMNFIGGFIIICLTSYFLVRKLKENTIKEYIEAIKKASTKPSRR